MFHLFFTRQYNEEFLVDRIVNVLFDNLMLSSARFLFLVVVLKAFFALMFYVVGFDTRCKVRPNELAPFRVQHHCCTKLTLSYLR